MKSFTVASKFKLNRAEQLGDQIVYWCNRCEVSSMDSCGFLTAQGVFSQDPTTVEFERRVLNECLGWLYERNAYHVMSFIVL